MSVNRQIIVTIFCLFVLFFLFEFTNIDIFVQEFFYDEVAQKWLLSHQKGGLLDTFFYTGIKKVIIVFGVFILFLYLYSFKDSVNTLKEYRIGLLIVWLSMVMIPLIIGGLKSVSNVPCPCDFEHFGGEYPYIRVLDVMPKEIVKKFKCYPAGHASGGFALMSLFFLFKEQKKRFIALGIAVAIGWSMGVYKMLIGDHYMSHTVITMMLSWVSVLIIRKTMQRHSFTN